MLLLRCGSVSFRLEQPLSQALICESLGRAMPQKQDGQGWHGDTHLLSQDQGDAAGLCHPRSSVAVFVEKTRNLEKFLYDSDSTMIFSQSQFCDFHLRMSGKDIEFLVAFILFPHDLTHIKNAIKHLLYHSLHNAYSSFVCLLIIALAYFKKWILYRVFIVVIAHF